MRLCSRLFPPLFGTPAAIVPGLAPAVTLNPACGSVRMGPGVRKASPRHALPFTLKGCENARLRPLRVTGLNDNQVSHEFWNTVHDVPVERATPAESLGAPETKLQHIRRHGRR